MESYSPTTSATKAVLTFLEAWTNKLHELGYQSGVYSSSGSGIVDLADQVGTGYPLPDDLWIANWNNEENTLDPVVPATAWANHQRIHQFRGGHDDTYGGVTINIDSDYVDGATVGVGTPPVGESDPIGSLELTGAPAKGQLRVKGWALDPDAPTEALAINVDVGGREGQKGVETYELGQIANLERPDVAASHKLAGPNHGFDTTPGHHQVGAGADLRLRGQRGARRQPPARLPDDDDPGRDHPLRPDARPAPGSPSTSPANSPPAPPAPATSASAPPTGSRRRAAANRRGSTR